MNRFFVLILSALILFGCGEKKDKNTASDNTQGTPASNLKNAPIENIDGTFLIKYKFEKGKTYNYKMTAVTVDNQSIHIKDTVLNQIVHQSIVYNFSFETKGIDSDSVTELNCNVTSVKLDADANGQTFSYESGVTADSASKNRYAQYDALVNNPFGIRVSKQGEVLELFRVDKIVNKYLTIKGYADSVTTSEKDAMRKDISEGSLKPLITQIIRKFPEHSVGKDSTWSIKQQPEPFMIFTLNNTTTYKVTNLQKQNENKLAVIDASMDSQVNGKTTSSQQGVIYKFKKPTATGKGQFHFNITDGILQSAKTTTEMNVEFSMEANTPQGKQKGSRSEKVTNTYEIERL